MKKQEGRWDGLRKDGAAIDKAGTGRQGRLEREPKRVASAGESGDDGDGLPVSHGEPENERERSGILGVQAASGIGNCGGVRRGVLRVERRAAGFPRLSLELGAAVG